MPHRHFPRSDPRYWSWAIKEIGIYDLPAIVDYVVKRTGLKPAYIGHSQGTGTSAYLICPARVSETDGTGTRSVPRSLSWYASRPR